MKKVFIVLIAVFVSSTKFTSLSAQLYDSLSTSVTYTADFFANTSGGFDTGIRYLDNIDIQIEYQRNDFTFFVYGLANQGSSISELSGDIQFVSNLEAENSWRLYEAWINVPITPVKSSLLLGLYDLNSEFDEIYNGLFFINSSKGIGADLALSGVTGPSIFPLTSLAARLKINLIPGITLKGAILDAVPSDPIDTKGTKVRIRDSEGSLMIGELTWYQRKKGGRSIDRGLIKDSPFRVAIGIWKYSNERIGWDGELHLDAGIYAFVEGKVYSEKQDRSQGLSLFGRFGAVNDEISRFESFIGTGLTYTVLFPRRNSDKFGLGASLPMNGEPFLESTGLDFADELIAEITYLWQLTDFFSLQFDAQYVANPNQAIDLEDAIIVGLRTSFSF
jgi:porin